MVALTGWGACKQNEGPATEKPTAQQTAPASASGAPPAVGVQLDTSTPSQAAGIAWSVPRGWEGEPPRQMRIGTYRIHAIAGDPEDAECAVYFFGAGQGGGVEANLDRWAHQFTGSDGSATPTPKINKQTVGGMLVSTIEVSGTYLGAAMMSQQAVTKPHFRMVAAIVEAPQGMVFFKLTGPVNSVAAAQTDFNSLLQSLHRQ